MDKIYFFISFNKDGIGLARTYLYLRRFIKKD